MGPDSPAPIFPRPVPRLEWRGDDRARLAPAGDFDREAMVPGGKRLSGPKPGPGSEERDDRSVFKLELHLDRAVSRDGERSEGSVPGDEHGRHQPSAGNLAVGAERAGSIAGTLDWSAQRGADA